MLKLNVYDLRNKAIGVINTISSQNNNVTPEGLAKLTHKIKGNKRLIGATAAGLLLPEILSTAGSAVSSMFGGSLYE